MNFYEKHCLPYLLNCACSMKSIRTQRAQVVPRARGRVLEVGMGTGLNLPYYNSERVEMVWGLEPAEVMRKLAGRRVEAASVDVEFIDLPGEAIPLPDKSVDTVLLTFTLCTIPDWKAALAQMHRVLKSSGKLIFCEHGEAPDEEVRRWQDRLNPYWNKFAGGCNLNRPIPTLIKDAGFHIASQNASYYPGPRPLSYFYHGTAVRG